MPNWVFNELVVKGDPAEILRFIDIFSGGTFEVDAPHADAPHFSFMNHVPLPTETEAPTEAEATTYSPDEARAYWGVKWDVEEGEWLVANEVAISSNGTELSTNFATAWSRPRAWLQAVSVTHPTLVFTITAFEQNNEWAGVSTCLNGLCHDGEAPSEILVNAVYPVYLDLITDSLFNFLDTKLQSSVVMALEDLGLEKESWLEIWRKASLRWPNQEEVPPLPLDFVESDTDIAKSAKLEFMRWIQLSEVEGRLLNLMRIGDLEPYLSESRLRNPPFPTQIDRLRDELRYGSLERIERISKQGLIPTMEGDIEKPDVGYEDAFYRFLEANLPSELRARLALDSDEILEILRWVAQNRWPVPEEVPSGRREFIDWVTWHVNDVLPLITVEDIQSYLA